MYAHAKDYYEYISKFVVSQCSMHGAANGVKGAIYECHVPGKIVVCVDAWKDAYDGVAPHAWNEMTRKIKDMKEVLKYLVDQGEAGGFYSTHRRPTTRRR